MRTLERPAGASAVPRPGRRRPGSLVGPAAALAGVLLAVWAFGPRGPGFTADDLALSAQIESLVDGSWTRDHPYPQVDPDGRHHPDHLAVRTADGTYAPYVKHPLPPLVLGAAWGVAGRAGAELAVLVGLLAAAVAVARLVRRTVPDLAVAALWVVGVGSALVVHGLVLWLHAWALAVAAVVVGAALGLVAEPSRVRRRRLATMVVGLVLVALLRTEGALLSAALAAGLAVVAGTRRRRDVVPVAALALAVGALTVLAERAWVEHLVGATTQLVPPGRGLLADRVSGVAATFLTAGPEPVAATARLGAIALLGLGLWRIRQGRGRGLWALVGGGAGLYVATLLRWPTPVPGLVPGLPLVVLPLLLPGRPGRGDRAERTLLGVAAAAYLALVAATAYGGGAGTDWGGRYALLVVPLLAPLVAERLYDLRDRLGVVDARVVIGGLVAVTVAAAPAAYRYADTAAGAARRDRAAIVADAARHEPAPATGRPVVIATEPITGRLVAREVEAMTALRAEDPVALAALADRLAADGVREVLLVGSAELLDPALTAAVPGGEVGPVRLLSPSAAARTVRLG